MVHFSFSFDDLVPSVRPSTASSLIQRLHVEKQGEEGMAIKGVFVATNCYIIILVMSGFFLVAGIVLTVISYRDMHGDGEEHKRRAKEYVRSLISYHVKSDFDTNRFSGLVSPHQDCRPSGDLQWCASLRHRLPPLVPRVEAQPGREGEELPHQIEEAEQGQPRVPTGGNSQVRVFKRKLIYIT